MDPAPRPRRTRDARRLLYLTLALLGLVGGWLAAEWYRADDALRCELPGVEPLTEGASLWVEGRGSLQRHDGRWVRGALVFEGLPDDGAGELEVPGWLPAPVTWTDGRCDPLPLAPAAVVVGAVHPPDGDIVVVGCDRQAPVGPDGSFYLEVAPEPCTLRAVRRDGPFAAEGPELTVRPVVGRDTVVDLALPGPTGGIGVRYSVDAEGVLVEGLFAGGAAEGAGVRAGDRIVAVDGQPTAGMDLRDFARASLGPLGTAVTVVVERDGERRELTLIRGAVDE